MYQVSRKTFMGVSKIIETYEGDNIEKAEIICELIEKEINGTIIEQKIGVEPKKETIKTYIAPEDLDTPAVESETQIETPPSGTPKQETKEEKMARLKEAVRQGRGQIDRHGNFTPTIYAKNLKADAKEGGWENGPVG